MSDKIIGKPFEAGNNHGKGRPKGSKNRKTLYKAMLEQAAVQMHNDALIRQLGFTPERAPKTIEEQVIASMALLALSGDLAAQKELMDGIYGKIVDKSETSTTINTLAVIRDDKGNELKFDIGSDPDRTRKQLEDDNE